jgi:competence protein ComEA
MKTWQHILLGTLLGLLCSAAIYLIAVPPKGTPLSSPSATPGHWLFVIFVAGQSTSLVSTLYLAAAVLSDAIEAAGGMLDTADITPINLALHIRDGDRINVPYEGEESAVPMQRLMGDLYRIQQLHPININTASQAILETLPGIGDLLEQDIILYREMNGQFHPSKIFKKYWHRSSNI